MMRICKAGFSWQYNIFWRVNSAAFMKGSTVTHILCAQVWKVILQALKRSFCARASGNAQHMFPRGMLLYLLIYLILYFELINIDMII